MVSDRKQGKKGTTLVHASYTVVFQFRSLGGLIKWYLGSKEKGA